MRKAIMIFAMILGGEAVAASAHWTGLDIFNGEFYSDSTRQFNFGADIYGSSGEYTWIFSSFFGNVRNGSLFLKHDDFSIESIEPTFNWWALAHCGDIVSEETFSSLTAIEDFVGNDRYTGGTLVENPDDFYMVFKASEVLLGVGDYEEGMTWYGWAHVSIDENFKMTLLGEGINLSGGAVVVGGIPEPSSALLLLLGVAALTLRRRRNGPRQPNVPHSTTGTSIFAGDGV